MACTVLLRLAVTLLLTSILAGNAFAAATVENKVHINGYANIVIPDANSDTYQIAPALRDFAQKKGLRVHLDVQGISEAELADTCVAVWSWQQVGLATGTLQMRIYDAISRVLVADVSSKATAYWTAGRAVRALAQKAFDQTGLTRFSAEQHRKNLELLFPARPKIDFAEKEFREQPPTSDIEGLWSDQENRYNVAIVKAPQADFDYVAVIVSTNSPVWSKGEIKMEFKKTAASGAFVGNYYPASKKRAGTIYTLERGGLLKFSYPGPNNAQIPSFFVKSWPAAKTSEITAAPGSGGLPATSTGTGFLVSSDGLVATNWHVVEGAGDINVQFPWQQSPVVARVAIKDPANDLAILRIAEADTAASPCSSLPYELKKASSATLGGKISTIGYPLEGILGAGPKYTEGSISALSGLKDDVRTLQISAAIQPGNSGSPLIDEAGDVIGIIVSTLSPAFQYKMTETLPQNINFAIKAEYLLNLMEMLPQRPKIAVSKQPGASAASRCVGVVRVLAK
jgi:S1-C subfamily serine protease